MQFANEFRLVFPLWRYKGLPKSPKVMYERVSADNRVLILELMFISVMRDNLPAWHERNKYLCMPPPLPPLPPPSCVSTMRIYSFSFLLLSAYIHGMRMDTFTHRARYVLECALIKFYFSVNKTKVCANGIQSAKQELCTMCKIVQL